MIELSLGKQIEDLMASWMLLIHVFCDLFAHKTVLSVTLVSLLLDLGLEVHRTDQELVGRVSRVSISRLKAVERRTNHNCLCNIVELWYFLYDLVAASR